jgi:serine/threonine protein phosphatase PrpC
VTTIKQKYYTISFNSQEKAILEGLKKANEFLEEEVKKDNIHWLGNLSFSLISINPLRKNKFSKEIKNFDLFFTKTGDIKILLLRNGQIIDIGKNLQLSEEIEPYPLKVFSNIASGKLNINDILLITTEDLYDFFSKDKIIEKIAKNTNLNEDKINQIFSFYSSDKNNKEIFGVCLLIILNQEKTFANKSKIFARKKQNSFYLYHFEKIYEFIKNFSFISYFSTKKTKRNKNQIKNKKERKSFNNLFSLPFVLNPFNIINKNSQIRKIIILFLMLVIIMILGFWVFR